MFPFSNFTGLVSIPALDSLGRHWSFGVSVTDSVVAARPRDETKGSFAENNNWRGLSRDIGSLQSMMVRMLSIKMLSLYFVLIICTTPFAVEPEHAVP